MRDVEESVNVALGEPPGVARLETLVGDMGYCALEGLVELQTAGVRTPIPDPVGNRRVEKLSPEQRQALRAAKRTCRSASGRWLMQHRGEFCERSFVHVLDYGGARRTTLRGRENILKRYLIQAACLNLSILLRTTLGIGTVNRPGPPPPRYVPSFSWSSALGTGVACGAFDPDFSESYASLVSNSPAGRSSPR